MSAPIRESPESQASRDQNRGIGDRNVKNQRPKATPQRRLEPCWACEFPISERHHVFGFSEFGESGERNIIYLCARCHDLWHLIESAAAGSQSSSEILLAVLGRHDHNRVEPMEVLQLLANVRISKEIVAQQHMTWANALAIATERLAELHKYNIARRQADSCKCFIDILAESEAQSELGRHWPFSALNSINELVWFTGGPYTWYGDEWAESSENESNSPLRIVS